MVSVPIYDRAQTWVLQLHAALEIFRVRGGQIVPRLVSEEDLELTFRWRSVKCLNPIVFV